MLMSMVERNGRDRAIIRGDETERNRIIKRVSKEKI